MAAPRRDNRGSIADRGLRECSPRAYSHVTSRGACCGGLVLACCFLHAGAMPALQSTTTGDRPARLLIRFGSLPERPAMTSPKTEMSVQYIHNVYSMDKSKLTAKPAAPRAAAGKEAAVAKAAKPRGKNAPLK